MLFTTWQNLLSDKKIAQAPGIYFIYDNHGRCLYVGQAKNVRHRLVEHIRPGTLNKRSRVGAFICRWSDHSVGWPIVVIEEKDFSAVWKSFKSQSLGNFLAFGADPTWDASSRRIIENYLIFLNSPIYNALMNNAPAKRGLSKVEVEYYLGPNSRYPQSVAW